MRQSTIRPLQNFCNDHRHSLGRNLEDVPVAIPRRVAPTLYLNNMNETSKVSSSTDTQQDEKETPAVFLWIERGVLGVITLMTLVAAGLEVAKVIELQTINLADILLMFLYLEVLSMIAVFYSGTGSPLVYPIFIAITALARLIVLQGKDMAPQNILYEAISILILAVAALIVLRTPRP